MSEWLEFIETTTLGKKTKMWLVQGKGQGAPLLGVVKWFGRWRQYCFFPGNDTIFNPGCMDDIATFCRTETATFWEAKRA